MSNAQQVAIRTVVMRGGTSRALFLRQQDLPAERGLRERMILALFGSPDARQVDGLGGADILTSKCAIVGPPSRPDADLDYTFAQVSVSQPVITYDIICGNISSAVGVYALQEGLAPAHGDTATVRIHVTNIGKVVTETVPLLDGEPAVEGDAVVEGVPGSGAPLRLDFAETVGGATSALLPTGHTTDRLYLPAVGREVEVSLVDIANVCVFARAEDLGWRGTEGPADATPEQLAAVDGLRAAAATYLGLPTDQLTPIPAVVAPPQPYRRFPDGVTVQPDEVDFLARVVGGRPPTFHKAFPGAGGICAAVAAAIPGTLPNQAAGFHDLGRPYDVRIGHPSGTFLVRACVEPDGMGGYRVVEATYTRTARRIMEGTAYVRAARLELDQPATIGPAEGLRRAA